MEDSFTIFINALIPMFFIYMVVLLGLLRFNITATKKTTLKIVFIFAAVMLGLICKYIEIIGLEFDLISLVSIAALDVLFAYLVIYRTMKSAAVICPNCGAWNEYREVEHLGSSTTEVWQTRDRAIRDSDYRKIGTYESRELHTYRTSVKRVRCTSCGEVFTQGFANEI